MSGQRSQHVSVMLEEVVAWLRPALGGVFVDGTLGGGGHTRRLAEAVGAPGQVVAVDRDPAAIAAAEHRLAGLPILVVHASFAELPVVLKQLEIEAVDGVLLDLGMSSDQLADTNRGFRFDAPAPLDLRFDPTQGEPAHRLLARLSERHLADLLYAYAEERHSRRIARRIVARRRTEPVESAADLSELVRRCIPKSRKKFIRPPARFKHCGLRSTKNSRRWKLPFATSPTCSSRVEGWRSSAFTRSKTVASKMRFGTTRGWTS